MARSRNKKLKEVIPVPQVPSGEDGEADKEQGTQPLGGEGGRLESQRENASAAGICFHTHALLDLLPRVDGLYSQYVGYRPGIHSHFHHGERAHDHWPR